MESLGEGFKTYQPSLSQFEFGGIKEDVNLCPLNIHLLK